MVARDICYSPLLNNSSIVSSLQVDEGETSFSESIQIMNRFYPMLNGNHDYHDNDNSACFHTSRAHRANSSVLRRSGFMGWRGTFVHSAAGFVLGLRIPFYLLNLLNIELWVSCS